MSAIDSTRTPASPPSRRLKPADAARYIGYSKRSLEDWRRAWREADERQMLELRKGPKFYKAGKHIRYEARDLDDFLARIRS